MLAFFTALKVIALTFYLVLAILTLRSKAERGVKGFFSTYLFGMASWQLASLMVNLSQDADAALFWYKLVFASSGIWTTLFFPFTRAFLKIAKQKLLMVFAFLTCAFMIAGSLIGLPWRGVSFGHGGYWVPIFNDTWMYLLFSLSSFFYFYGIFNLVRGLGQERSPVMRNRIIYVILGASIVIIGLSSNLTDLRDYPVDISFNLVSALVIVYAVVRHKLLDIRFILVRSLFYSILTVALIVVYLGIVLGLESVLKLRIGYTGPASGIVAILIIALIFLPVRNASQKVLDRLFFREKSDYQKATQIFSRDVTSLYDTGEILDLVGTTIMRSIKPLSLSITLLDEEMKEYTARKSFGGDHASAADATTVHEQEALVRWLRANGKPFLREEAMMDPQRRVIVEEDKRLFGAADVSLVVPIILKDRLTGLLNLGPKLSGTMYNDDDLRFLTTIANQTATAIEKSIIFREMERRLSEQTLLFILSEKFRSSADFDSVMISIVQILKNFLGCESCALVCFEKEGSAKRYAIDPLSERAAEIAAGLRTQALAGPTTRRDALPIDSQVVKDSIERRRDLTAEDRAELSSMIYFPLQSGTESLGMLIIPNRSGGTTADTRELELLRTIRAIISQGIILYRTILNLVSLKTYNENILNSLNDMGDTLVILDLKGSIKSVNKATSRRLGYSMEELVGRPMSFITGEGEKLFRGEGLAGLAAAGSISNYEMSYRTKEGATIPMLFSGSVMVGEDGKRREIVGIARDITEHLKAEEMTKNMLLIKEIHHRIKNNLQVISSLLYLQSGYVQDEKTREMFRESQNRVRSMAILHEKLYQSHAPKGIAFSEYVRDLTRNLFMSYGEQASAVDLSIDITDVTLDMDTAVPCGLIINELVSNALKHAFSPIRSGKIRIAMAPSTPPADRGGADEKWYRLIVCDDGKGFPQGLDFRATESLGLKLVCTLTEQLKGTIGMDRDGGTRFTIQFREL